MRVRGETTTLPIHLPEMQHSPVLINRFITHARVQSYVAQVQRTAYLDRELDKDVEAYLKDSDYESFSELVRHGLRETIDQ